MRLSQTDQESDLEQEQLKEALARSIREQTPHDQAESDLEQKQLDKALRESLKTTQTYSSPVDDELDQLERWGDVAQRSLEPEPDKANAGDFDQSQIDEAMKSIQSTPPVHAAGFPSTGNQAFEPGPLQAAERIKGKLIIMRHGTRLDMVGDPDYLDPLPHGAHPIDPPIIPNDPAIIESAAIGEFHVFIESPVILVISPFKRCLQTAVQLINLTSLLPRAIIIDYRLGEDSSARKRIVQEYARTGNHLESWEPVIAEKEFTDGGDPDFVSYILPDVKFEKIITDDNLINVGSTRESRIKALDYYQNISKETGINYLCITHADTIDDLWSRKMDSSAYDIDFAAFVIIDSKQDTITKSHGVRSSKISGGAAVYHKMRRKKTKRKKTKRKKTRRKKTRRKKTRRKKTRRR